VITISSPIAGQPMNMIYAALVLAYSTSSAIASAYRLSSSALRTESRFDD
jgi:hypothetical protein